MRRSGHPSRPRAITCCFFASLRTLLISTKATCLTPKSTSRASFSLAGFQVTIIGRFWVTAGATIRGRSQNSSFVENRLASLGEYAPGNQDDILAGAIEDEIHQLIRFQIETFRQPTPLSPSQLLRSSFPCGKNQGAWQG